jgi:hypothetical protein
VKKSFAIVVVLFAAAAHADQFHFTIPLKMTHLTAQRVLVKCNVYATKPAEFFGGSPVASKTSPSVSVDASGNVDATVQLDLDSGPGKDGMGKYYQCGFLLGTSGAFDVGPPDPSSPNAWQRPKAGTKLVARHEDYFPPALHP